MTNNNHLIPEADRALENLRNEVASELGIHNYANIDRGALSSRENGRVGGNITRELIARAERSLANENNTIH